MLFVLPQASSLEELNTVSLSGAILIDLRVVKAEEALSSLKSSCSTASVFARLNSEIDEQSVIDLANQGVEYFVIPLSYASSLVDAGIPNSRLIVEVGSDSDANATLEGKTFAGVLLGSSFKPEFVKEAAKLADKNAIDGKPSKLVLTDINTGIAPATAVIPIPQLDAAVTANTLLEFLQTDRPDGLYYTNVVDTHGTLLGTCFSSKESIAEAIATQKGVYQSRKRGIWRKGESSGAVQKLLGVSVDCDGDALQFTVEQQGAGFCHQNTWSCFGPQRGIWALEKTIQDRLATAVEGSYTQRLFNDSALLRAKIMEEAEELCDAESRKDVAFEAADLIYFMAAKLAKSGVSFADVERSLDAKSLRVTRRKGDSKPKWQAATAQDKPASKEVPAPAPVEDESAPIHMKVVEGVDAASVKKCLERPAQSSGAFEMVKPIIAAVLERGDAALLEYTEKFEKAKLSSPVLSAPFSPELMAISDEMRASIDIAVDNVDKFHRAQLVPDLEVETMPGVLCSRLARPIDRVGLYVPGGTAVLPSTTIMLGVPAKVAGCREIVVASPPRPDGTLSPEIVYVAHKIGATKILLAGGAQAVAALAYGTESCPKVDKILGPGNQFVTAAKMLVSTDLAAQVSIDMPAGPSEVLVVADQAASKAYVASDLLSQAEHGADSQVILIAIKWSAEDIAALQTELDKQARALPRCAIVRKAISHSAIILASSDKEAMDLSNQYAPEHLILQTANAPDLVPLVANAGSIFVGAFSPESCGDYSSGTNHTLPTYGYANQYSGVNTGTYQKYITSQELTSEGLLRLGRPTELLALTEGLHAHARAVTLRLDTEYGVNWRENKP